MESWTRAYPREGEELKRIFRILLKLRKPVLLSRYEHFMIRRYIRYAIDKSKKKVVFNSDDKIYKIKYMNELSRLNKKEKEFRKKLINILKEERELRVQWNREWQNGGKPKGWL
jgi:hypothetical protein